MAVTVAFNPNESIEKASHHYEGLSTDTKPTVASHDGLPEPTVGSTFWEHDTNNIYRTYNGTNWVVKGGNALFSVATGAVAIAKTLAPAAKFRLLSVTLHMSSAPTTSQNFTVTLDAGDAAAYDTVLVSRDLSVGSVTDQVWTFGEGYEFESDDEIDIAYTNTDTRTYGLRIVYELI